MFTGAVLPAASFIGTDLVTVLAQDDHLVAKTDELVTAIAKKSPLRIAEMKQLIDEGLQVGVVDGLRKERDRHLHSDDFTEGLRAFHDKRAPNFTGR